MARDRWIFALLGTVFVPLIVSAALGQLHPRRLLGWAIVVALVCAGLGYHDILRASLTAAGQPPVFPSNQLWLALAFGLFIAHSLIVTGTQDGRFFARYPNYFATAWKYGLQILMAALFVGCLWGVLWLGTELFKLIKIDLPSQIIGKNWFRIPVTTVAINVALHVTDVRVGIVRGIRGLSCTLLSWLLPLLTAIAIAFIVTLAFTGLELLWNTRRASSILLAAAAILIFLVNSAYQDGTPVNGDGLATPAATSPVLRLSIVAASIVLVPLIALALYGIFLRIGQYGLTPQRILALACAAVAACYAAGYAAAAIFQRTSFSWLERTNIATSFVILAILLALFTPVADPARLAVADQIKRLHARTIAPDKLDYKFLRFDAGRYGMDALQRLAEQPGLPIAAAQAADYLKKKSRYEARATPLLTPFQRRANIIVTCPSGRELPDSFLEADWSKEQHQSQLPICFHMNVKCDAVLIDLDGDGIEEIVLLPLGVGNSVVFKQSDDKTWSRAGSISHTSCPGVGDALREGKFDLVEPRFKDIVVAGHRLSILPQVNCGAGPINGSVTISPK